MYAGAHTHIPTFARICMMENIEAHVQTCTPTDPVQKGSKLFELSLKGSWKTFYSPKISEEQKTPVPFVPRNIKSNLQNKWDSFSSHFCPFLMAVPRDFFKGSLCRHQPAQYLSLIFFLSVLKKKKKIICFVFGCGFSSQLKIKSHAKPTTQHVD